MESNPRTRFPTTQAWHDFMNQQRNGQIQGKDLYDLRGACYQEIEALRERPLLVYASRFLDMQGPIPNNIDLTDVEGFRDLIHTLPKGTNKVDVLLHSPGGRPDATERIVSMLRSQIKNVTFLVPHSAYSAATMLALSGDEIILHPNATLGPIDPQINNIPARSIKRGFESAAKKIRREGPEVLPAYVPLIEKYSLELLEICEDSEKLSKALVTRWLKDFMFAGDKSAKTGKLISKAVKFFSEYDRHLMHSRPLTYDKLNGLGLKINVASEPLAGLLWEVFIQLNGFFSQTPFVKLYETSRSLSWGKQHIQNVMPITLPRR